jgi:hypothetical protein
MRDADRQLMSGPAKTSEKPLLAEQLQAAAVELWLPRRTPWYP